MWIQYLISIIKLIINLLLLHVIKLQSYLVLPRDNNNPKISVIVPVYNAEKYLDECLSSLISQTFKSIEIICINDGSTDNSLNILKRYESKDIRIKLINQENKGAGAARNTALKIARGDYIAFVDADDYADPNYLKIMYNEIKENKADVCVCRAEREDVKENRIFEEKKLLDFSLIPNKVFSYRDIPENFFQFTNTVPWNKMFKKKYLINNRLYFQEIKICNDYFFIYSSLVAADRITTVNKILYTQRIKHDINLHSSLYKFPYCFLYASQKLYNWLVRKGVFNILQNSFIKAFIKLADYNLKRCKQYKDIYNNVFYRIKEEFNRYEVEKALNKLDSNLKQTAKIILFSEGKEYENFQKNENNIIPIAMATDNNYVLPTIVSMISVLENANIGTIYKYTLLVPEDFLQENKNKFLDLQMKYRHKCELDFINMGNIFHNSRVTEYISYPMYYRLNLANLLNEENKCIFLDGDTIVNKDLSELYNLKVDGFYLAGIKAAGIQSNKKRAQYLNISNMKEYINSGVLLMNLKEMRNEKIVDKFSRYISEKINSIKELDCPDQDTINSVCYGKIKILPLKYNVMTDYKIDDGFVWQKNKKFQKCFDKSEWIEAFNNPVIIHYAGRIKPWNNKTCNMAEYWLKYASKIEEYNEIKKQIWYNYFSQLTDEKYPEALKDWYIEKMGSNLNLEHPKTYTEKIQWLKLNDMDELKTNLSDKYLVRDYVKSKIGEKYLIKLLGVWDNFDDIDFDKFPNKFVLKANHGCGFNIIIREKSEFNKEESKAKFEKWLNINFAFRSGLELQYKNIKPKIIAEEYLENNNDDLYDYKVWCFDGKPYYTMFLSNRKKSLKMAFYDNDWRLQPFYYTYKRNDIPIEKPDNLDELLYVTKILSEGFKHVRVDFYRLNDGTLKFGEMTFTSASGYMRWHPKRYNKIFGDLIKLPMDKSEINNEN